jgi:hypothetical protein
MRKNFLIGIFCQTVGLYVIIGMLSFSDMNLSRWASLPLGLYMFGFALGLGASSYGYTADILPPKGVGFAMAIQWVFTSLVSKVIPIVLFPL